MQRFKNPFMLSALFATLFVVSLVFLYQEHSKYLDFKSKFDEVKVKSQNLETRYAKLQKELENKKEEIKRKDELIATHKTLIAALRKSSAELEEKYNGLFKATQEAAKAVNLFKKRAEADEMLLAKYSKVFFLNEHYEPSSLSLIPANFSQNGKTLYIKSEVLPFLQGMLEDMQKAGLDPKVVSAYRSFGQQASLKGAYLRVYGSGANKFSADQGYSEHQLGTTVDIVNSGNRLTIDFENTDEFKWLKDNAWRYGFVLSYPKGNSYYIYEPWHWRFVGVALAEYLKKSGKNFYDLPQRQINDYLIFMFDKKPIRKDDAES